ncbi:MAG: FAD-dependent oxidoreductase [Clostridia bacterium]|nr:FAD-dependent oxidoreductase [Clostridia bacterium]
MRTYDIVIIGGGPAGLTAAVYAGRANKSVVVLEKGTFGGQITSSPKVENIPGFQSVTGNEFADKLMEQAVALGTEIECCEVEKIVCGELFTVETDEGSFLGKTVIIATGTRHRLLGLPKEEDFIGNGISFCAVCDGAFYEGKTVAVIGGGNSALQEALLLSETCKKVYVVQNLGVLTGEDKLQKAVAQKQNIEVIYGTTVKAILGEDALKGLTLAGASGETELAVDGVFVAIGLVPQNGIFEGLIQLDGCGYIVAGEGCETNLPGVFVAGDCRTKKIRQVATAAADGAVAALAACSYLG